MMGDKYSIFRLNEIIAALSKKGVCFQNSKESHAKYINGHYIVVIPIHNNFACGTLKSILIQTGIDLDEFIELL
jgi:predicted RNA binding protein YcfA (HicA-like mRNA interferase family)